MNAKELINYLIPPLKPTDEVTKAKMWMEELRLNELPVTSAGKFIGIMDEEMLLNDELKYRTVGEYPLIGKECKVHPDQHFYEVLKVANDEGLRLVAVVDEHEEYLGVITVEDVVEVFAKSSSATSKGAILILKLGLKDYSLSEISRIIESNEAKILSSFLSTHKEDPSKLSLTLKVNTEDISHIVASLEQKGFGVESSYNSHNVSSEEMERIDILMKYIKL